MHISKESDDGTKQREELPVDAPEQTPAENREVCVRTMIISTESAADGFIELHRAACG